MALIIHTDGDTRATTWRQGEKLTEAAAKAGIALNTRCAGNGVCGGCAVKLGPGRYRVNGEDLRIVEGCYKSALACQTEVVEDGAVVTFPRTSVLEREAVIDDAFSSPHLANRLPAQATTYAAKPGALGLAVDIGTTTVAAMLVDLHTGEALAKASMYNQQIRKADDVASRISYGRSGKEIEELQRLVTLETLDPLASRCAAAAQRDPEHITRVMVSGNTVMTHLFFGLSPASIGVLPFTPLMRTYPPVHASTLGLLASPEAMVEAVPSVAGYVGGDIVSDIYLTGLHEPCEATLMIDVGTNGEMVFRDGDRVVACATAAGPAFEGYGLAHGCRAATGAIERIAFDASLDMDIRVIGHTQPTGLCGSAIIDFIANGLRCGLINEMGRYNVDVLRASGRYVQDAALCGDSIACLIVPAEASGIQGPLCVTEQDIAQVLKAKAAIYAGLTTMLETQGLTPQDVKRVYLAGGFARHISLENAVALGLFPDIPLHRYEIVGNGSLAGAYLGLLDARVMPAFEAIIDLPEIIELNRVASFESHFIDALALPHFDVSLFPSVFRPSSQNERISS
jgi:uncharacterized 2Fe-2S/4Fe-4S cluster protein (DUF4445 family)